ncbi:hypothetical protein [Methylobacterium sp. PvR107]|uniref:hypothetical protein n=1 Tax=Methylobacterium sp. PvR107 TaxID=2806597 RepID=UPI001AE9BE76|nr:hypothetical protein [Methylobacterium sp. PvR107]MBP1181285.1 hypothetical protein [Methylobacterium sp. PvR107]
MRMTARDVLSCLILAVLLGGAGLGLRRALPVTPVDAAFRAVLSAYAAPAGGPQQHD